MKRSFLVLGLSVFAVFGSGVAGFPGSGGLCTLVLAFLAGLGWGTEKVITHPNSLAHRNLCTLQDFEIVSSLVTSGAGPVRSRWLFNWCPHLRQNLSCLSPGTRGGGGGLGLGCVPATALRTDRSRD